MGLYQKENKRLGRGLEDISSTFLSGKRQTKDKNMNYGFSSFALREAVCSSCLHFVQDHAGPSKCNIFTFGSEKHGVKYLSSVALNLAKYCEYYQSRPPVLGDKASESKIGEFDQVGVQYEVEETVTLRKEIAYQNIGNVQQKMRTALSKHIQQGYSITQVVLKKTEAIDRSGTREQRDEEVIIYSKPPVEK